MPFWSGMLEFLHFYPLDDTVATLVLLKVEIDSINESRFKYSPKVKHAQILTDCPLSYWPLEWCLLLSVGVL